MFVTGASAPPTVVLAGAAAVAAGATAPRAVDSTGAAVVVAGPSVTGDAVGGVVFAAGGPLRFGSTGAVLVTAACALSTVPDALVADCPGAPADGTIAAPARPATEPETELVVSAEAVPAAERAVLLT